MSRSKRYLSTIPRRLMPLVLLALTALATGTAQAEILVIANPQSNITTLTREQVVDIYMGRSSNFPNGRPAIAFDLKGDQPARAAFYQQLVGKSVAQINAYWARLLFTGSATPPMALKDTATMLHMVQENRDAIGYIDSAETTGKLNVVFRFETPHGGT
jgi:ABC-type phosphate transport system substrate-binding protein